MISVPHFLVPQARSRAQCLDPHIGIVHEVGGWGGGGGCSAVLSNLISSGKLVKPAGGLLVF